MYRHVVLISGKKAIHEALVSRSIDFADRPEFFTQAIVNKHAKGSFTFAMLAYLYFTFHIAANSSAANLDVYNNFCFLANVNSRSRSRRRPFVCRLSVCNVCAPNTQVIDIFGNISMPFGTSAIC